MVVTVPATALPLHTACVDSDIELVRLPLQRDFFDPNSQTNEGRTPLFAACDSETVCVEGLRLLLEAVADPSVLDDQGFTPLHLAAYHGHTDLVDMPHYRTLSILNSFAANGETALRVAYGEGHERTVSKLLSLGAMEHPGDIGASSLVAAIVRGFFNVVRVIVTEGGMRAVGGDEAMPSALGAAVQHRRTEILRILLTVGGHKSCSRWTNIDVHAACLIHFAASFCYPDIVSLLLAAGAHEAAQDVKGVTARDVIGLSRSQIDPSERLAVRRMLHHGPAYRARFWAWPVNDEGGADGGGDADDDLAAIFSCRPSTASSPVASLRIVRPKLKYGSDTMFTALASRYCAKKKLSHCYCWEITAWSMG